MKHQRSPLASVTIHTALILGAVVMVFPLLWMLVTSIKTITEATIIPPTLWPDVPQWQNWMVILIGDGVLQTFFHTLLIALLALALQLLTSSTGAYAFARLTFPGRDRIFLMFMASLMVPTLRYADPYLSDCAKAVAAGFLYRDTAALLFYAVRGISA